MVIGIFWKTKDKNIVTYDDSLICLTAFYIYQLLLYALATDKSPPVTKMILHMII